MSYQQELSYQERVMHRLRQHYINRTPIHAELDALSGAPEIDEAAKTPQNTAIDMGQLQRLMRAVTTEGYGP